MINFANAIALLGIFSILFGILYVIQHKRKIYLPEGFTTDSIEYKGADVSDITNPISKVMAKLTTMSLHFANPEIWKDAYTHSQMSITDLARKQIAKDRAEKKLII